MILSLLESERVNMNHPDQQWTSAARPAPVSRGLACHLKASIAWFAVAAMIGFGLVMSGTGLDGIFSVLTWVFAVTGLMMSGIWFVQTLRTGRGGNRGRFAASVVAWIGVGLNGVVAAFALILLPYSANDGPMWIALLVGLLCGAAIGAGLGFAGELLLTTRNARQWLNG